MITGMAARAVRKRRAGCRKIIVDPGQLFVE